MSGMNYNIDSGKMYTLKEITRTDGTPTNDKFHAQYIGLTATNLRFDEEANSHGFYRMRMDFVKAPDFHYIVKKIHTSGVREIEETGTGIKIKTANSIYVLEEDTEEHTKPDILFETLELVLSLEAPGYFCSCKHYDGRGGETELEAMQHSGMNYSSVLLWRGGECVFRYFVMSGGIMIYGNILGEEDPEIPIMIHNSGENDISVHFDNCDDEYIIAPESTRLIYK